jgi:hypothetical protein
MRADGRARELAHPSHKRLVALLGHLAQAAPLILWDLMALQALVAHRDLVVRLAQEEDKVFRMVIR